MVEIAADQVAQVILVLLFASVRSRTRMRLEPAMVAACLLGEVKQAFSMAVRIAAPCRGGSENQLASPQGDSTLALGAQQVDGLGRRTAECHFNDLHPFAVLDGFKHRIVAPAFQGLCAQRPRDPRAGGAAA